MARQKKKQDEKVTASPGTDEEKVTAAAQETEEAPGELKTLDDVAKALEADKVPEPEKCREWLKYFYTTEERETLASQMAQNVVELTSLEEQEKSFKASMKSKKTALQGEITNASRALTAGYEMRNINCILVPDHTAKTITIIRQDTNEEVRTRKMTLDEQQRQLFAAPKTEDEGGGFEMPGGELQRPGEEGPSVQEPGTEDLDAAAPGFKSSPADPFKTIGPEAAGPY